MLPYHFVEAEEVVDVFPRPPLRVRHHGARFHDERPIAALCQEKLTRRLIDRPSEKSVGIVRQTADEVDQPVGRRIKVPINPIV